jgi:hypothetical protein
VVKSTCTSCLLASATNDLALKKYPGQSYSSYRLIATCACATSNSQVLANPQISDVAGSDGISAALNALDGHN